jgi:N-acylneuraminate cytidylyltransferase
MPHYRRHTLRKLLYQLMYGAQVIKRPAEISDDTASSEAALLHAIHELEKTESYRPDIIVFMQCTSPLTLTEDIDGTIKELLSKNADSALTVARSNVFLWRKDAQEDAVGINHDKMQRPLRQQRVPEFSETGAVYVMRVSGFLKARHRFFGKTVMHVVPQERAFEIDEPTDLKIISAIMKARISNSDDFIERANKIKLLVSDVDGVLTDAGMYYSEAGDELKKFNTRDGVGLEYLRKSGIMIALMTREKTDMVSRRGEKLKVDFIHQGIIDKETCLVEISKEAGCSLEQTCYVGDDIHDIAALCKAGLACCPADACEPVRDVCHHILERRGGQGCIRELAELILRCQNGGID